MPAFNREAFVFALAWAALALAVGLSFGWQAGALVAIALMLVVMPTSIFVLNRADSFRTERLVRWSILATVAAAAAILVLAGF